MSGVRRRDHRIRTHHPQRVHAAWLPKLIEHLVRRETRGRERFRRDPPNPRHMGAMGRIIEFAIAGKLIRFLPVLAGALPVPLPGDV
jgi:hypothetical protein